MPISDIVELNVGGNKEFEIRKTTLQQVPGSALDAMFSGRHSLPMKNNKVFVDRDPKAFKMMVDFIRNNGKMYEEQEKNYKMLQIELEFWGIDEKIFNQKIKSK